MPRSTGVKDKVDEAAVGLFAARGVDGVSIAEIAAAAGVSQGALYRHYASKEELAWMLFRPRICAQPANSTTSAPAIAISPDRSPRW